MAGRGMGAATKGGGCVSSGARNKMTSKPSTKVAVMMKDGGEAKKIFGAAMTKKERSKLIQAKKAPKVKTKAELAKQIRAKKEAKNFPDLTGDGKVTKKDVLKARGVKMKMGGGMMKKYKKGGYAGSK